MLRRLYETSDEKGPTTKLAILGALHLYLDFVNIFVHLLNLLGRRR
jgi:FtsH-binding integral membrane protein